MPPFSIRYGFSQHFNVPAIDAYRLCTDYEPADLALMGENGERSVKRISEDAIILIDTMRNQDGRRTIKRKIVRLYPERLSWTSTHLTGPNKHSQFLYEIVSESKNSSHLDFTGLQVNYDEEKATPAKVAALAGKLRKEDSGAWKKLAAAMEKDLRRG
jgi:hypothetical protein